ILARLVHTNFLPPIGDHSIVSVSLRGEGVREPPAYWKMPKRILKNKYFTESINELLTNFIDNNEKSLESYEDLKFEIRKKAKLYLEYERQESRAELKRIERLHSQDTG